MNVYRARELQKASFKSTGKQFKLMRSYLHNGQLFYQNIFKLRDNDYIGFRDVENSFMTLTRINQVIDYGGIITFQYIKGHVGGWPDGMYVLEAYPVD